MLFRNSAGVAVEQAGITAFCSASPSAQLLQLVLNLVSVSGPNGPGHQNEVTREVNDLIAERIHEFCLVDKESGPYFDLLTADH